MKSVHKYVLPAGRGRYTVPIREGAILRLVGSQGDRLALWYEVDPTAELKEEEFHLLHTGEEFDPSGMGYIGTASFFAGNYIVHVYKKLPSPA